MPTLSVIAAISTEIYGQNATYATARSTSAAFDNVTNAIAGQRRQSTTNYYCYRLFLKFDTSSMPDNATITKVNLRMAIAGDYSTNDFDVMVQEQDWSGQDAISDGNRETAYDNCLAEADSFLWRNTSGISTDTQYTGADMTTGYVNKTGTTYYSLISSRDIAASAPGSSTTEYVIFHKHDAATEAYRPTLLVEYALPGAPVTMISEYGTM